MAYLKRLLKIPKKKRNKKIQTKGKIRIHEIEFKNTLISKPSWLSKIKKNGRKVLRVNYKNHNYPFRIDIYRRDNTLKNVVVFDIKPPLSMFDYMSNIRVFTKMIKYDFKLPEELQWIPFSYKAYQRYIKQRRGACKLAREWLAKKGFKIDVVEPRLSKSPSCAIDLEGKLKLGTMMRGEIRLEDGNILKFDDSPGRGQGEIEGTFNDINRVFKETPEKVEKLEFESQELKKGIHIIHSDIQNLSSTVGDLVYGIKDLINILNPRTNNLDQNPPNNDNGLFI
ncbi:MAG: hypothetical protein GF308_19465 [Candidatus Heimdallarchaeota archaeon]|nr:hypothetical protein [Candidatus Heimdallarchaeota archaeon]